MSATRSLPRDQAARTRATTDFAVNLVVSAGAGTGKTTLLVERLLTALASGRVGLQEIAAISFTEKAAGELRHRLADGLAELRELALGRERDGGRSAASGAYARSMESGEAPSAILERAREAEQKLDRATVTTIHGLCAEILRAFPLASGVPPGFTIDRGPAGRRVAAEEWAAFVTEELGPRGRRLELWSRLLQRFSMSNLADIARALTGGSVSDALLDGRHRPPDLRAAIGPAASRIVSEIREAVDAAAGLTNAPRAWLEDAVAALQTLAERGAEAARELIGRSERLTKSLPDVYTKKVAAADAARLDELGTRARRVLRGVKIADEAAEADLFEVLLPFARRLRARFTLSGLIDFDGLLVRVRDLLRDVPAVRDALKRRFAMVLVDEFQDTDPIQYEIVFFLAERDGGRATDAYETELAAGSLFIVGDAKQSIYRFRGADYGAYRHAVAHVLKQGGAEIALTSNFRSIAAVLEPVNALFAAPASTVWRASAFLPDYEAVHAERAGGDAAVEVWTTRASDDALAAVRRRAEGMSLAAEIAALAGSGKPWRFDDVLVLFRGFSDLGPYLRALREAGVPFVVSGGRTFFERTEIVQAMAVLRAVADSADPVAQLAYRRSPAGGVPDTELAAATVSSGPALAAADRRLEALRAVVRTLPVDLAVRRVLEESGLFALAGLSFEGAQRVANLEKLALAASDLARDGRRTLLETLEALEEGFDVDEEGDSPLADESLDAVRVMSIHKAKGLEAPIVILADTAAGRSRSPNRRFTARMVRVAGGEHVRLEGAGFMSAAALVASLDEHRHEEAEDVRLLYVALTRARERLFVFGGGGRRRSPWSAAVSAWGPGIVFRTLDPAAPPSRRAAVDPGGAPQAVGRYAAALDAIRRAPTAPFRSPSDLGGGAWTSAVEQAADALLAREVGRIVHERLAGGSARGEGASVAEAESILREFAATPAAARLAALDVVGREVPMLLAKDGVRWRGSIDLLYRDADGGLVIADFKTDASDEGAVLKHRGQLGIYAEALRRAVPGARVRAELWMLRSGRVLLVD